MTQRASYQDAYDRCDRCGARVVDDTTDFGNGLVLRTTCQGIEFRIERRWPEVTFPGLSWTPGITRAELLEFLGIREAK